MRRHLLLVVFVLTSSILPTFSQPPVLSDDFYVIDRSMYLNVTLNDDPIGGYQGLIITNGAQAGAGYPGQGIGAVCNGHCPYVSRQGTYIGYDFFTYQYFPCCGTPAESGQDHLQIRHTPPARKRHGRARKGDELRVRQRLPAHADHRSARSHKTIRVRRHVVYDLLHRSARQSYELRI